MKYSVIIPVYNAEDTVQRCLDSLLQHIPDETELLVINDGSRDGSGEICKKYASEFSQIRYFEKKNGGVSSARNLGLDHAEGEYILFADSDDYVSEHYWQTIVPLLEQHHPDMLQYGFRECGEKERERNTGDYAVKGAEAVAEKVSQAMRSYMFSALWDRTFMNSIIQKYGIRFDEKLMIGEDQVFIFDYAMHMQSMMSISEALYNVLLENTESLSRKRRDYLAQQLTEVNQSILQSFRKAELKPRAKSYYCGAVAWVYYRSAYSSCKELLKYELTAKERRRRIQRVCKNYTMQDVVPQDWKCWVIALPVLWKMSMGIDFLINH